MKKGFTLIELLAVIVILAVIALIATPIIINIIEDAQKNAAIASAQGYVRAVNYKIAQEVLNDNIIEDGDYTIGNTSFIVSGNNFDSIGGLYTISNGSVLWGGFCINNYSIEYNSTTGYTGISEDVDYCDYEEPFKFEEPDGVLLSEVYADQTKYTNNTYFKIKTVEDLVALSELVNGGKDFTSKTIYLVNDIDIEDTDSYTDSINTTYGDINGDNTTSGLLVELTTGSGFKPIGNSSNRFKGTLEGFAFKISNLFIDRSSNSNIGLFGYVQGTIKGINLVDATITGYSSVGGITGYFDAGGNIKNIIVTATITGTTGSSTGGIVGYATGASSISDVVFKGTVTGKNQVGGIAGSKFNNTIVGLVYDSTITGTGDKVGRITTSNNPGDSVRAYNTTATSTTTRNSFSFDGTTITSLTQLSIDAAIDTVIGGDTDGDHYYFDVQNGEVVLYSGDVIPIRAPKGEGTEQNPYIIKTVKDWNRAVETIDNTPHYYTLVGDLDFTNQTFYPFGSVNNKFNGVFDGNQHTISNVNVSGYTNTGVFGYITGTVKNVNFDHITVTGSAGNTGIIGKSENGTINGIKARNVTVTGTGVVGGLVGFATGTVRSVDIQATVTGTGNSVGGVVGDTNSGFSIQYALFKGAVTGADKVSGILGNNTNNGNNIKSFVYDSTITGTGTYVGIITTSNQCGDDNRNSNSTATTTATKNTSFSKDGTTVAYVTLETVDGMLDTVIGGDIDGDKFYFDYNSTGGIELYSTDVKPFGQLQGEGTQNNPYIINSINDWNAATTTINATPHYYSLTSDLDFTDKLVYPMGTKYTQFNGIFSGNHHTISNANIRGYNHTGVFGYNTGTITDTNFDTISISASAGRTGIIGTNTGTVNGVKVRNLTITGTSTIGGICGYLGTGGSIKNVDVHGTITGTSTTVGGIIGYADGSSSLTDAVFKGTLSGTQYVAGLAGEKFNTTISGFVYDSTITATSNTSGYFTTRNNPNNCKAYNITISPSATGTLISSKTLEAVATVIDTTDSNGDGYSFTLTNGDYELVYSN